MHAKHYSYITFRAAVFNIVTSLSRLHTVFQAALYSTLTTYRNLFLVTYKTKQKHYFFLLAFIIKYVSTIHHIYSYFHPDNDTRHM
jgi:hypothetical protein